MRILQICSARDIGGGERHVADLANALSARGHELFAAVRPKSPLVGELNALPGKNVFEMRLGGAAAVTAAGKFAGLVREHQIDIIHAHLARDYPLTAFVSARSAGTPFVLTRHVLFPMKKINKVLLRRASRVIAVSNAVAESLKKQNIFDPKKVVTIHNGVETSRFTRTAGDLRRQPRDSTTPLTVGTIGHIAPIKGQEAFVRAAAIVARERDDVDFVIVGEDKSPRRDNRAALENLIKELGLGKRVRLVGWQPDTAESLREFDIFVSPSRSEPFGLVIIEAMAAGVPVVATASEGALEIVDDGINGLLVPIGDAAALAAAVSRLLDDPPLRQRLAYNAREHVDERFSLRKMVDATENVYHEVLS